MDHCEPIDLRSLRIILLIALALRLATTTAFPNLHHPDEVYQYLEQGHRFAFGYGVVPWEYKEGIRSWCFPGFLGIVMYVCSLVSDVPELYLGTIKVLLIILSLSPVVAGYLWAYRRAGRQAAIFTAMLCAVWFELVYFSSKTLTEAVAAHVLLIAICLVYPGRPVETRWRLLAGGATLGLVIVLRMHLVHRFLNTVTYSVIEKFAHVWHGGRQGASANASHKSVCDHAFLVGGTGTASACEQVYVALF